MSSIQLFNFKSHEVRTVTIDSAVWFVAADIAKAVGYSLATDMTKILDDDERGMQIVHTPSGDQPMIVISESGLYHALLKSRKPEAQPFRKWITADVLPAIRKTGSYSTEQPTPEQLAMDKLLCSRFIMDLDENRRVRLREVPRDACVMAPREWPGYLRDRGHLLDYDMLPDLISAAAERLNSRIHKR